MSIVSRLEEVKRNRSINGDELRYINDAIQYIESLQCKDEIAQHDIEIFAKEILIQILDRPIMDPESVAQDAITITKNFYEKLGEVRTEQK